MNMHTVDAIVGIDGVGNLWAYRLSQKFNKPFGNVMSLVRNGVKKIPCKKALVVCGSNLECDQLIRSINILKNTYKVAVNEVVFVARDENNILDEELAKREIKSFWLKDLETC